MVIMALDHSRDLFSDSAALFDPTDLHHTTPALFFTRWITHFCAPIFVFLAGLGSGLGLRRATATPASVSRFLVTRGLWLVFLEFAVISPLGWSFNFSFAFTRLQVIWVIGLSMVILAGLIRILPSRILGALGLGIVLAHNLFDGHHALWLGPLLPTWKLLHSVSFFQPFPHIFLASLYPMLPWLAVMMLGFSAAELFTLQPARRQTILFWSGCAASLLFLLLRGLNLYGDPVPWSSQPHAIFSLLSFLKCNKYPPSLLYLTMTLGPGLMLLALLERLPRRNTFSSALATLGRVPLFYYLLHLPLLHAAAVVLSLVRYGSAEWVFQDFMALRNSPHPLPAGYGYSLPVVYAIWIAAVLVLYPACCWFARLKQTRSEIIFRYL